MKVLCQNSICCRWSAIQADTVYCQFCGALYADQGIAIKTLLEAQKEVQKTIAGWFGFFGSMVMDVNSSCAIFYSKADF